MKQLITVRIEGRSSVDPVKESGMLTHHKSNGLHSARVNEVLRNRLTVEVRAASSLNHH